MYLEHLPDRLQNFDVCFIGFAQQTTKNISTEQANHKTINHNIP